MSTISNGDFISIAVCQCSKSIVNIHITAGDYCSGEWRKATQSGVTTIQGTVDHFDCFIRVFHNCSFTETLVDIMIY